MSSQALASLTATYTDSEGEDANDEGNETPPNPGSRVTSRSATPLSKIQSEPNSNSASPLIIRVPKLVSYHDDTVVSDEEAGGIIEELIVEETGSKPQSPEPEPMSDDGVQLPPEPKGKCPAELQDKIARLYEKMQSGGLDMNSVIQKRKDFRNPSIYEKLIHFCDINEFGTNYPAEVYDPLRWGKESFYEELAKAQKADMERREKERKERTKVEFVSGTVKKSGSEDDPKRRKSKWDQPAANAVTTQALKPAGLIQPTLTTTATGTKGTVISAFGSLPKKPRL